MEGSMRRYFCPHCGQELTCPNGQQIKLRGVLTSPYFTVATLFYLPAELGVYGGTVEGEIEIREGARVEFQCFNPDCLHSFTSPYDDDLSEIRMVEDDGTDEIVVFNRVYGRQSTYVVDYRLRKVIMAYGEDKDRYVDEFERPLNFFGE